MVGNTVLTEGFRDHLEEYYDKATPEDQARCLELLTALGIAKTLREPPPPAQRQPTRPQRPKTAMAALYRASIPERPVGLDMYGPYTTTYAREFLGNSGNGAHADRPASTQAYQASFRLSGPIGTSSYKKDYCNKVAFKNVPIRSGSSSGSRRNNPHPHESFMKWRLPARTYSEQPYSEWAFVLTDDIMDRVCRGKLQSTYQSDYLGIPQGQPVGQTVKPELDVPLPEDWRTQVPYSLRSIMRHSYQKPKPQVALKGNNSRYGCNKLKSVPANGVVPTVSRRQLNLKSRTTYEREFVDKFQPETGMKDVRSMGRYYTGNSLAAYAHGTQGEERDKLQRMMATLDVTADGRLMQSTSSVRSAGALYPPPPSPSS